MKIKDYRDAQNYYAKDDRGDSTGAFKNFVRESRSMVQEPRNMYSQGQLVRNTVDGSRPGYGGRPFGSPQMGGKQVDWTLERKSNLKAWMDARGTTLKDYKKASPSKQWSIREGQTTGIQHSKDIGKHLEGPKSKAFRAWLDIQDPDIKSRNLQDLMKQSQSGVNRDSASRIVDEPEYFKKFGNVKEGTKPRLHEKIITKHLGRGLYQETSPTGNVSYFGSVKRKGKTYKKRFRDIEDAKEFIVEKKKLPSAPTVIEQQVAKGNLLEQPKYKKALVNAMDEVYALESKGYGPIKEITKKYKDMFSKKGTMQFGKKLTTDITTEGSALINAIRSESKKLGIYDLSSKKTEKALDFYLNKKEIKKGDIVKIAKKFDIQYGNLQAILERQDLRRKIPLKYKNESEKIKAVRAKRDAALKKYSSPGFEKWTRGTAESGIQGGHTGQIYSEDVTPKTKKFTPAKINQETLKRYDATLEGITGKRDKAFKAGNWAEVERLNKKGMEYASATEGYKTFTIKNRDGTKSTWGSTTKGAVDPYDLIKEGITAKDMESYHMGKNPIMTKAKKDFKNKIISKAELETINAAEVEKLFAEGKNKGLLDFQKPEAMKSAEMSKKEITALDKRLRSNLIKLGCPGKAAAEGGRISFDIGGSTTCITRGLEKLKNPTNLSPGDKANIRALKKMSTGAKGIKILGNMARVLGKFGIVSEGAIGGLLALNDYAGGANNEEIISNFTYGLAGKSQEEQLKEQDPQYGLDRKILTDYTGLNTMGQRKDNIGRMSVKPGIEKQLIETIKKEQQPFMSGPRNEEFDTGRFFKQEDKSNQADIDYQKAKDQRSLERRVDPFAQEAITEETDFMAAEGGLAGLMKKYYD